MLGLLTVADTCAALSRATCSLWPCSVAGLDRVFAAAALTLPRRAQFWCTPTTPIACDAGDSLCSNDYNQSAAFVETATVNGQATNLFKWHENLGPIPMNEL